MLDSLGYHDSVSLGIQQKETLVEQVKAVEKWLRREQAETVTESKVFCFLGEPSRSKVSSAGRLVRVVGSDGLSVSALRKLTEDVCKESQKASVDLTCERYRGRPFNCFECLPTETSETKCMCCSSMLFDACILCLGTSGEERSMLDEFRRFVEENILAYSVAVNSWLKQEPLKQITWLEDARYVSEDGMSRIAKRVHSFLGRKSEAKEWLAACLLKTVKDNQRWHKRTEIIDDFPEAASYFGSVLERSLRG